MSRRRGRAAVALGLGWGLALAASAARAEGAPDAGSLLRDIQRTTPSLTRPPAPARPAEPEAGAPAPPQGQTVVVRDFRIQASLFPEAVLKRELADYIGRACSLGDLNEAAARLSRYYRDHDYLARAYLPPQTIRDGVVEIIVLEGRLGRVSVDPASPSRLDPDLAVARMRARQPEDGFLRPGALREGLDSLNGLPGVEAGVTLVPGAAEGQSDLLLRLRDTALVTGAVQADNFSPRSVGSWRGLGMAALNDPLGWGDLEQVTLLRSNGSSYGRLALSAPAGSSGLTLGLSVSSLSFAVDKEFNASGATGTAVAAGVSAAYPLLRGEGAAVDLSLAYDHKRLRNQTATITTSAAILDVLTAGMSGAFRDDLAGGGLTSLGLGLGLGRLDLSGDDDAHALDLLTARSQGGYARLTGGLSRLQPLRERTELLLALSGQWAGKNLDSSEKFSLGGPGGIRAYPVNEGNGDEGWLATAELRQALAEGLQAALFVDVGGVTQHVQRWPGWQGNGSQPNAYSLAGAGLGLTWQPVAGLSLKVMAARALGGDPAAAPGGYEADGRRDKTRLWLQMTVAF